MKMIFLRDKDNVKSVNRHEIAFIKFLLNLFRKTKVQYHNGLFFQSAAGVES